MEGDWRAWRTHLACGAACITSLVLAVELGTSVDYFDMDVAQRAGRMLLDGHLDVYALEPLAQMGPLALAIAGALPTSAFIVALTAVLYGALITVFRTQEVVPDLVTTFAAVLVGAAWHQFAVMGHADDALVLSGVMLICYAERRRVPWLAAAGFVLAVAAKPTAVLFLPLVFLVSRRAAIWAVVGMAVVWLPFALADLTGFLTAGRGVVGAMPYSIPGILGAPRFGDYPVWVRPTELVAGLVACWLVGRKVGFTQSVVVVYALRAVLEPGTFSLYWVSIILAGFSLDLSTRQRIPWFTIVGLTGWCVTFNYALTGMTGFSRLALLIGLGVAAVRTRTSAGRAKPSSLSRGFRMESGTRSAP